MLAFFPNQNWDNTTMCCFYVQEPHHSDGKGTSQWLHQIFKLLPLMWVIWFLVMCKFNIDS